MINRRFLATLCLVTTVASVPLFHCTERPAFADSPVAASAATAPVITGNQAAVMAAAAYSLSKTDATALQTRLSTNPNDMEARIKLMGYLQMKQFTSEDAKKPYADMVLWAIQNIPDSVLAGLPCASLVPGINPEYDTGRSLWLQQVKANPTNTAILGNAAQYLLIFDFGTTENLLSQALALEPANPQWMNKLAELYSLQMINASGSERKSFAQKALLKYEQAFKIERIENQQASLAYISKIAFEAQAYGKAKSYANQLLASAKTGKRDWNYGNDIFYGNFVLGRLALHNGNIAQAKVIYWPPEKTPGSPQLDSFGPNMTLAKELLEKGERQTVLTYFHSCSIFWKDARLTRWTAELKQGLKPDLSSNLLY